MAPLLDVRHLQALVTVADVGSVTAAATRLRVVQQALSRTVAEAERLAGATVFTRRARGMHVTAAGRPIVFAARLALEAVQHVQARSLGQTTVPAGDAWLPAPVPGASDAELPLRIGLADSGHPATVLPHVLRALRYLGVRHVVVPLPVSRHAQAMRDGLLDVGFYVGFTQTVRNAVSGLADVTVLAEEPLLGVLLPSDHALALLNVVTLEALRTLPLIDVPHRLFPAELDEQFARLDEAGWRGRAAYEIDHGYVIAQMIISGAGWAHVAAVNGDALPSGMVYRPLAAGGGTPCAAHVLVREAARLQAEPVVRMLVELCATEPPDLVAPR